MIVTRTFEKEDSTINVILIDVDYTCRLAIRGVRLDVSQVRVTSPASGVLAGEVIVEETAVGVCLGGEVYLAWEAGTGGSRWFLELKDSDVDIVEGLCSLQSDVLKN